MPHRPPARLGGAAGRAPRRTLGGRARGRSGAGPRRRERDSQALRRCLSCPSRLVLRVWDRRCRRQRPALGPPSAPRHVPSFFPKSARPSGDNPWRTSYFYVDSLFNAVNALAVVARECGGIANLHQSITDWHQGGLGGLGGLGLRPSQTGCGAAPPPTPPPPTPPTPDGFVWARAAGRPRPQRHPVYGRHLLPRFC